jgi:hypothetical protein
MSSTSQPGRAPGDPLRTFVPAVQNHHPRHVDIEQYQVDPAIAQPGQGFEPIVHHHNLALQTIGIDELNLRQLDLRAGIALLRSTATAEMQAAL